MPNSLSIQCVKHSPAAVPLYSRILLLTSDVQQSVLGELDQRRPNPFVYSPHGLQSGVSQAATHLGFNGQLKEQSTGWYHLGNGYRVYNPLLMRFHSPDRLSPFGKGGVNAYAYCQGDPVNYSDPTGQWPLLPLVQRGLTVALHSVVPIGMILGPKVSGVALGATRVSLAGSVGSAVGAAMQIAGYSAGAYVNATGTTALLAGAATRGAVALKNAFHSNHLWKTVKDNVKNILGLGDSPSVVQPPKQFNVAVEKSLAHETMTIRN
jgi:RHS repeat-associated protein